MTKRYFACVYGGASESIDSRHKESVENLGKLIAKSGFDLVYGAGASGCMGAVARGIKAENGFVMGVMPDFMSGFESLFECDETIVAGSMAERKIIMEKHADIFFITPGGIGTMDEFFQVLTLKYLKRIDVPIVVVNLEGFYDSLINLIDDLIKQGAAGEGIRNLYDIITEVNEENIVPMLDEIKEDCRKVK